MIYAVDPLHDTRWRAFVESCPNSSVFHNPAWLEALRRTYGYQPQAYTTASPGTALRDGLVFCRVASWLTGRRIVSLPFSDHCEPLVENPSDRKTLLSALAQSLRPEKLRYLEIRAAQPLPGPAGLYLSTESFCFHQLDLTPDLAALYAGFHKSSTQRKIQRAERDGLRYEAGRSPELLEAFWRLLLMTRRRHRVPPQPRIWFRNLIDCFGPSLQIRVAFKDNHPVAAILTLRHKDTLVYKYGGSDPAFNNLGGTHLLFWKSIQEAKSEGLQAFDLGRSDLDNPGLITFKDRWGAARSTLTYSRFSVEPPAHAIGAGWPGRIANRVVPFLPDRILTVVGSVLYRHIA
jgi:CelD/BcsL family acetyltransferase involved in cellulose biosynthesis